MKSILKHVILLSLLLLAIKGKADKAVIYGTAKTYAGKTLRIEVTTNPFLGIKKDIQSFKVAEDGTFRVEVDLKQTELVTIPLYVYAGFLYVQPNKEYEIKLPPFSALSPAQKLNAYFEPEELMLGVVSKDKNELNRTIRMFDDELDRFINRNFTRIYLRKAQSVGVDFSKQLQQQYGENANSFFQEYMKYRLGFLEFLASPNSLESLQGKYFANGAMAMNNPACVSLFKKLYGSFFDGYLKHKNQLELSKAMAGTSPYKAINALIKHYPAYQNDIFRNRIMVTAAYNSFVRKMMSKPTVLDIFKSVKQQSKNPYNRMLCNDFIAEITHLQKKMKAPNFDVDGKTLADYKGKYLYLNFCNTQNYTCQQDLRLMQKLHQQFGKYVKIISLVFDSDIKKYQQFQAKHNYEWDFLLVEKSGEKLLKEYGVKALPFYVLIDDNGNIIKANAPSPKDNIRSEFIKITRKQYQRK